MKFFKTLAVSALLAALIAGAAGASAQTARPSGGGDIVVLDIVDSAQASAIRFGGPGIDILIAETTER